MSSELLVLSSIILLRNISDQTLRRITCSIFCCVSRPFDKRTRWFVATGRRFIAMATSSWTSSLSRCWKRATDRNHLSRFLRSSTRWNCCCKIFDSRHEFLFDWLSWSRHCDLQQSVVYRFTNICWICPVGCCTGIVCIFYYQTSAAL